MRFLKQVLVAGTLVSCVLLAESLRIEGEPKGSDGSEPSPAKEAIARGKLAYERYCKSCHSVDGTKVMGMSFEKAWGTKVNLAQGDPVDYDEDFFRESVLNPSEKITKGYANVMTPFDLGEPQLEDLIEYMKSLGETEKVAESEKRMVEKRQAWLAELEPPTVNIRRIHFFCNDLKVMRQFYSTVLRMQEIEYKDNADRGWLTYRSDGFEIVFRRSPTPVEVNDRWGWLPGAPDLSDAPLPSFSLEFEEKAYRLVVANLDILKPALSIAIKTDRPVWRDGGYWGWAILDPMGNTVELTCRPSTAPDKGTVPVWKD